MTMHKGVNLESRYCDKDEFDLMREMVDRCGQLDRFIEEIFCDSKACNSYSIELKPREFRFADRVIAKAICEVVGLRCQDAAYAARGGHNGIFVSVWIGGQRVMHELAAGFEEEEEFIEVPPPPAPMPQPIWAQPAGDPVRQ